MIVRYREEQQETGPAAPVGRGPRGNGETRGIETCTSDWRWAMLGMKPAGPAPETPSLSPSRRLA